MKRDSTAIWSLLTGPREAGTPGAAEARRLLRDHLGSRGFQVAEEPFAFLPTTLHAFPLFGAGLGWLTLLSIPLLTLPGLPPWGALLAWLLGLPALMVLVLGVGRGWTGLGGARREDANLVARREGETVRRWLVAHIDSKAQGHSLAGRILAIWIAALAVLAFLGLAAARLSGAMDIDIVAAAAALSLAACGLAGRGGLRGESPGARDNASGVYALVRAAANAPAGTGLIVTGAAEFGLVGARIFARDRGDLVVGTEVVVLDTLDDRGPLRLVTHNAAGRRLAGALLGQTDEALPGGGRIERGRWWRPVESHPFAAAGAAAVTLTRGDWATFRRIHTPLDTADDLTFETAESVGRALGRRV